MKTLTVRRKPLAELVGKMALSAAWHAQHLGAGVRNASKALAGRMHSN
jgi:hypothetical protein